MSFDRIASLLCRGGSSLIAQNANVPSALPQNLIVDRTVERAARYLLATQGDNHVPATSLVMLKAQAL